MRIQLCISPQVGWERALAPIGALVFFIEDDVKFLFQHRTQPDFFTPQNTGCEHGVEDVGKGEIKIPLEADQVVLGSVEDFFVFRISKERGEGREVIEGKRINEKVTIRDGKLDETDLFLVGVQAVRLGVHGDEGFGCEFVHQGAELSDVGNEFRGGEVV